MNRVQKQELLDKYALPAGGMSFVISILLGQFSGYGWTDFLAGMFTGLSVVLNLYGLYHYTRARRLRQVTSQPARAFTSTTP